MRSIVGTIGAAIATLLGLVVLAGVVVVVLLQAGALNGLIEDRLTAAVGRPARLEQAPQLGLENGFLTFDLGRVSIANADWARQQHERFAAIERVQASLRLAPLLRGRVELPEITIEQPEIHLARAEDGRVNWPKADVDAPDEGPTWLPEVEHLAIRDAKVTYVDAAAGTDLNLALDQVIASFGGGRDLALQAGGTLQDEPLEIEASGGPLTAFFDGDPQAEPVQVDATVGQSRIRGHATSFEDLDALEASVHVDAEQTLAELLSKVGLVRTELPPFQASMQVEPGEGGSSIIADLTVQAARLHVDGRVGDLSDPMEDFAADIRAQGDELARLLPLAGIEVQGDLPELRLAAHVVGREGVYQLDGLDAQLGENRVTGQAAVRDVETLDGLEADLFFDAPELSPILASFEVPYADQVPSAKIHAKVAHDNDHTTASANGAVGGDTIELQADYLGAITAFQNPTLDLQLEGSALGALPAQLGYAARPIERYRIDAQVAPPSKDATPVKLDLTIEDTRIRFDGSLDDLRALKGVDGRIYIEGPDPAAVQKLFGLPPTSLPPYDVAGHVTWRGDDIKVAGLDGKVGDSDLGGDIAVDLRPQPPTVTADLQSDRLDFDDLGSLIGAPARLGEDETVSKAQERQAERFEEEGRLLPAVKIDPDLWQNLDLDVRYNADRIESDYLPIDRIRFHVASHEGWLTLDPLVSGLADGTIVGFASVDGTRDPVAGEFDIRIDALQLQDMLAKLGGGGEGFGEINGRVRLRGQGRSVDAMLSTADGDAVLSMTGGALDSLIVEGIGLDIAESLVVLADSAEQPEEDKVPIRCAIANLKLDQGIATTRPVVIDTTDSKITVDGTINLKDETLDILVESHPKDPSLFSANQPIHVEGPILSPSVGPAPGDVENKALGWLLAPIAAVLPFFDLGTEQDSPCGRLVAQAKDAAAARPEQ